MFSFQSETDYRQLIQIQDAVMEYKPLWPAEHFPTLNLKSFNLIAASKGTGSQ